MDEPSLLNVLSRLGIEPTAKRRRKGWVDFRCPMAPWTHKGRGDRNASAGASISPEGPSAWHCFTCKSHGRVSALIDNLGRLRGADYGDLAAKVRQGEEMAGLSQDYGDFERVGGDGDFGAPLIEEVYEGVWEGAWEAPEAQAYLVKRGIGEHTARELGLLFRETYEREDGRPWHRNDILFPVRDREGGLWGWTGRTTIEAVQPKVYDPDLPKRRLILGAHRWRDDGRPLVLVEGLFGYAHLIEIGAEIDCDVGALMGSVLTPEKAEIVRLHDAPTFLLLDNDQAGEFGIFGPLDAEGIRHEADGAIAQLQSHVPLFVPDWPLWPEGSDKAVQAKDDPDQITIEELRAILWHTPQYIPPPKPAPRRYLDKRSGIR